MQKITLEGVKAAARDYYERGMLAAQHAAEARSCKYRYAQDWRCAVGAALDDETLNTLDKLGVNTSSVSNHQVRGVIHIEQQELDDIGRIQSAHDVWLRQARDFARKPEQAEFDGIDPAPFEAEFKRLIGIV